jgi:non-ribosomal peptide synthetase component F
VHSCTLDRSTLAGLKQIARQEQVTLFMILHGLYALLLSRHSNSHDIAIGTGVASRPQQELEPLVGFFVNMLVLRSDCRPGCTFREYLAHIKSVNLNAQANQDVPLEYLVERLKPQRSASHTPLFQIAFTLNQVDTSLAQLPELEFTPLEIGPVRVKFDLVLEALETTEDLRLIFTYNSDLFEESTIARLGEHLQNLARGVVVNADERIEMLPLLSESERRHLLYELNNTAADYPRESCLQELFEAQVELRPESVAVVFADRQLSYRELNEQANQVAHYLREQGVGPDTLVGLFVDWSPAMVVGLLGIVKAGGAYVPLDPRDPAERLEYIIADSSPVMVVTQDLLEHRLPLVPRLRLDADKELLSAYPPNNPRRDQVGLTSEHLAYVVYISGSTGTLNGVMAPHRSIVNRLNGSSCVESDVCCQKTSLSSVDSVSEIFAPLLAGTPLVIIPTADLASETALDEKVSSNLNHPIANTQIYILDESMQPVPLGLMGEIYVAGDNLGRGYLRNPELTAEKFLPCPYTQSAGARMYRTGEVGRWLPGGSVERLIEHQILSRQEDVRPEPVTTDSSSDHDNAEPVLLTAPAGLDLWLHPIVESLYRKHAPLSSPMVAESCVIERLPDDPSLHADFISERCGNYQHSLENTDGPLFRAVYLQAPVQGERYLFVVTHHSIVDSVSWRVLLRDLDDAYRQIHTKGLIQFADGESSYKQWGEATAINGNSDALQPRMDQWPTSNVRTVPLELSTGETAALLNDCTATFQTELNELLLVGFYLALHQWSGRNSVRITLEEHDSDDLFPEIDVAEIVGCFITTDPLLLQSEDGAIAEVIEAVKEQYRAATRYGMGYGLLGNAGHDVLSNAALRFNQQSDFSHLLKTVSFFALSAVCLTVEVAARSLRLRLDYDKSQYNEETIAVLVRSIEEALRALIARSRDVRRDLELKERSRVMKGGES